MDTLKILVVDDEARMRKLVKDFLTNKGFAVIEAVDGEEAVDVFFAQKDIALVLLDVMMPKMDGWEVLRTIRKYSQVPVIMLTARSEERDELQGFSLGSGRVYIQALQPQDSGGTGGGHSEKDQRVLRRQRECGRNLH